MLAKKLTYVLLFRKLLQKQPTETNTVSVSPEVIPKVYSLTVTDTWQLQNSQEIYIFLYNQFHFPLPLSMVVGSGRYWAMYTGKQIQSEQKEKRVCLITELNRKKLRFLTIIFNKVMMMVPLIFHYYYITSKCKLL